MADEKLTQRIREKALELGYVACGFTGLESFDDYQKDLEAREGYAFFAKGGLSGEVRFEGDSKGARCVICLVDSYAEIDFPEKLTPYIGRAYLSKLYGGVCPGTNAPKHKEFRDWLHEQGIRTYDMKGFMQMPDREMAARAGVVTFGRNNFAYCREHGSLIILTNIVVDADLVTENHELKCPCPPDCHACIDACPTHAMDEEGKLNAMRCVLYNNMFPEALIDKDLREQLGVRIHGCDECQKACPRNKHAFFGEGKVPSPLLEEVARQFSLESILEDSDETFAGAVGRVISPYFNEVSRHRRNAAVAMGNSGNDSYLPALMRAAKEDEDAEVREAAQWAAAKLQRA